jgi:hypothetical protein
MSSFCANFLAPKKLQSQTVHNQRKVVQNTFVGKKAAPKMLVKLRPEVNYTNILRAAFAPTSLRQKIANPNCNQRKAAKNNLVQIRCL